MFPAMLLGPNLAGIFVTKAVHGGTGLRDLFRRLITFRVGVRWYGVLLVPPLLVLTTLRFMSQFVSPALSPLSRAYRLTFRRRFFRGDWLDGICVSTDAVAVRLPSVGYCSRNPLGCMAHSRDRFSWGCGAPR